MVHSIYLDFDQNSSLEVRGYFLDIYKAFDQVESLGVSENLLELFPSYLNTRQQRVVINGQYSKLAPILAVVIQV